MHGEGERSRYKNEINHGNLIMFITFHRSLWRRGMMIMMMLEVDSEGVERLMRLHAKLQLSLII